MCPFSAHLLPPFPRLSQREIRIPPQRNCLLPSVLHKRQLPTPSARRVDPQSQPPRPTTYTAYRAASHF
ncbi:Myb protein [Neisseria gonorrhoeae NCCP11945]|uniref:Myb protein n=1 Tax=Neisseria gonorrhoeae (strain NCCP11945) TaxID=521006 RepID=B4RKH5_NEIG2|nr:Myb protein [Neisseria gonorrhoeae NCCP11945]